jgi:hypothetical protein
MGQGRPLLKPNCRERVKHTHQKQVDKHVARQLKLQSCDDHQAIGEEMSISAQGVENWPFVDVVVHHIGCGVPPLFEVVFEIKNTIFFVFDEFPGFLIILVLH